MVGAAILDEIGFVLAGRRKEPRSAAGLWEFPGGKVEPGESVEAALVRECEEELGILVEVIDRVADDAALPAGDGVLSVWRARIVVGTPVASDHSELRWLGADELDSVRWMPADLPFVEALRPSLPRRAR
ncbi:(deoxy)nucleoside triphosphate pyrophosphohydrolase [Fodinicola feengrottensis]|uniref:8-oxo-dGTP diphosphatase n=1 Tax=Fodinicola feengrottensis TaxID=435914 RepID=A0ABN2ILB5_9ACTN